MDKLICHKCNGSKMDWNRPRDKFYNGEQPHCITCGGQGFLLRFDNGKEVPYYPANKNYEGAEMERYIDNVKMMWLEVEEDKNRIFVNASVKSVFEQGHLIAVFGTKDTAIKFLSHFEESEIRKIKEESDTFWSMQTRTMKQLRRVEDITEQVLKRAGIKDS